MALPDLTYDKATRPGGTGRIATLYKLDCPRCRTISVGDDLYSDWREGQAVVCRGCGYLGEPETRKVDLAR